MSKTVQYFQFWTIKNADLLSREIAFTGVSTVLLANMNSGKMLIWKNKTKNEKAIFHLCEIKVNF